MKSWNKIIENNLAIVEKLDNICNHLIEFRNRSTKSSFSGKIGIALFFFIYSKLMQSPKYYDFAIKIFDEIFDEYSKKKLTEIDSSYENGLSGLVWAIGCLRNCGAKEFEGDIISKEITNLLLINTVYNLENKKYDLFTGAIGNGLALLQHTNELSKSKIFIPLVEQLENIAIKDNEDYLKWESNINPSKKQLYNIGLAHGIPSIILFLSKLYENKMSSDNTPLIIEKSINYLLKQKLVITNSISFFPNYALESEQDKAVLNSRLAWCYGDLGIAVSLYLAGKRLNISNWENEGLKILLHSTKRTDLEANFVSDPYLCHGTTGIAHIYNRMYNYSGIEEFKNASMYWFNETIKFLEQEKYTVIKQEEYGIVNGISGIGLSLISAISTIEPSWDECLLLS